MNTTLRLMPSAVLLAFLAAGCATIPEPIDGEFTPLSPEQSEDRHVGERVRWGGSIVDTRPGRQETCIEILAKELDERARPHSGDTDQGRFLACREGFEDPAVFESGRDITVVGTLRDFVEGNIGDFRYVYPRVEADTLFLWGEDRPVHYSRDPFWYYGPWWPYGPRYGFSGYFIIR